LYTEEGNSKLVRYHVVFPSLKDVITQTRLDFRFTTVMMSDLASRWNKWRQCLLLLKKKRNTF